VHCLESVGTNPDCYDSSVFFNEFYEEIVPYILTSSLHHQFTPEQPVRRRINGHHFGVNGPIDPNALLLCAWMMSEVFFS
jgi:hypothetical protein